MSRLGVSQIKDYVQSLPKNTIITRKLIQDFIDANDVNVNFQNLFTKNRPAYVGNFIKDKSITIDSSYPTGSKRYKKAKAIINDPKLKKEFIKFGNKKGVSIKDIRKKFNIGLEEFYEGGLRELFDKDFQLQQASKLKPKTINNITTLLNDKEASSFLKKGEIVPDKILTKLKIDPSGAATATVRIGQIYGGNKFDVDAFKKIRTNTQASDKLFETMNKFAFGNPYRSKLYNASLELIDEQLGNEKGTFASLKKKASYILKKNKIKGFDINEIAGVSGTAKSGAGEFSQFIDVMDRNLNQKQMASFQSAFSQARQNIANNPNNFEAGSKRINKLASRFEREYGVKLPRIRDVGDVEKFYSPTRLKQLSDQGLDIKSASQKLGYTIEMPKGAITATEFVEQGSKGKTFLNNFIKKVKSVPGGCRAIITRALGGPLDSCEAIIKADPERAAVKLNNAITATKGPLKDLKQDSQKLIRLFRGESFPQRNTESLKSKAKFFNTTMPEVKKDTLSGQWFTPNQQHASSYLAKPGRMKYVDVTPAELESFNEYKNRVNKRQVKYSVKKQQGLPDAPLHNVTDSPHHQIIPRYKLKQMEKAGRLKSKLDLNPFKQRNIGEMLVKPTAGVLEYNVDLGAFVDSKYPTQKVTDLQIKNWAAENPMSVKAGTEDALKPIKGNLLKTVGKSLAYVGAPLPTALIDSYFVGKQISEDKSAVDIAKDPLNWLGLATMSTLSDISGVSKPGKLNTALRLGMSPGLIRGVSRFAGLPGLAISTALTAYDQYQKYQNEEGLIYNLFNKESRAI
jgi:hypothetical protein